MKSSIALIGYMGTGKTAVGKLLSKKLGMKFIETDALIEQKAGKKIPKIFQEDGEIGFRSLEIRVTREICGNKKSVIACGGGLVLNQINIDRLKQEAVIVYLTALPEVIMKRVSKEPGKRPLLEAKDQSKTIGEMLKFRRPFYERAGDITINTSNLDIDEVSERIIAKLKKNESFNF